ncbi:MAG: hypothetical protein AAGK78_04260, partial [Planctomycetota bacterium]
MKTLRNRKTRKFFCKVDMVVAWVAPRRRTKTTSKERRSMMWMCLRLMLIGGVLALLTVWWVGDLIDSVTAILVILASCLAGPMLIGWTVLISKLERRWPNRRVYRLKPGLLKWFEPGNLIVLKEKLGEAQYELKDNGYFMLVGPGIRDGRFHFPLPTSSLRRERVLEALGEQVETFMPTDDYDVGDPSQIVFNLRDGKLLALLPVCVVPVVILAAAVRTGRMEPADTLVWLVGLGVAYLAEPPDHPQPAGPGGKISYA